MVDWIVDRLALRKGVERRVERRVVQSWVARAIGITRFGMLHTRIILYLLMQGRLIDSSTTRKTRRFLRPLNARKHAVEKWLNITRAVNHRRAHGNDSPDKVGDRGLD